MYWNSLLNDDNRKNKFNMACHEHPSPTNHWSALSNHISKSNQPVWQNLLWTLTTLSMCVMALRSESAESLLVSTGSDRGLFSKPFTCNSRDLSLELNNWGLDSVMRPPDPVKSMQLCNITGPQRTSALWASKNLASTTPLVDFTSLLPLPEDVFLLLMPRPDVDVPCWLKSELPLLPGGPNMELIFCFNSVTCPEGIRQMK